jgi:ribose/xylose/arabinose/galactoside ABC-type transport system permease subunit
MKLASSTVQLLALLSILVLLMIAAAILSPLFLSYGNMINLLTQVSFTGILAIGLTFVILTGGIDLSVGSIVSFSSIFYATLLHGSIFTFMPTQIFVYSETTRGITPFLPLPLNLLIVLLAGGVIGLINGSLSYYLKLHSFVITMGMMFAIRGLAMSYTNGQPIFGVADYTNFLAYGSLLGFPIPAFLWLLMLAAGALVLSLRRYGRRIYAVGGNEAAARLSGIMPAYYRISPFIISGVCAAFVGILMTGRMGAGDPTIAKGWELDAIAAVVIGGTILQGGRGNLGGTLIGALIVGVVANLMDLLGLKAYPQQMVKGLMIIAAVAFQNVLGRIGKVQSR